MLNITHRKGDPFGRIGRIPLTYADGYFVGWIITSQVRDSRGSLISQLATGWLAPENTTRLFEVTDATTDNWPLGQLVMDIRLESPTGGVARSQIINITCERSITHG